MTSFKMMLRIYIPDSLWWIVKYSSYFEQEIIKLSYYKVLIDGGETY